MAHDNLEVCPKKSDCEELTSVLAPIVLSYVLAPGEETIDQKELAVRASNAIATMHNLISGLIHILKEQGIHLEKMDKLQ